MVYECRLAYNGFTNAGWHTMVLRMPAGFTNARWQSMAYECPADSL